MIHHSSFMVWPAPEPVFHANWIAPNGADTETNYYFYARRKFTLEDIPEEAVLAISAESLYSLYVNGQAVGEGPVRGTKTCNFYDSWNIASLLRPGENWLAVLVACLNKPTFKYAPTQPALLVQFGEIGSDADWQVCVSPEWRRDVPMYTLQIGAMEWRDINAAPFGWTIGLDNQNWSPAAVLTPAHELGRKLLLPRDIPALQYTSYPPVSVPVIAHVPPLVDPLDTEVAKLMTEEPYSLAPGAERISSRLLEMAMEGIILSPPAGGGGVTMVFDFAQEVTRGYEIDLDAPLGTIMDVACEEELVDGRLKPFVSGYRFADRYILREGRQRVGPPTTERGLRMIQITLRNFDRPITIRGVRAIDRRYPVSLPARFVCNDHGLNKLWELCAETLSACATDTFIDCPWRESAFWVNDFIVENQTWLNVFGDHRLNARCLKLALSQIREDGLIPGVCPTSGVDGLVLIATNLFVPTFLEDYLLHTGDRATVQELMPATKEILKTFLNWQDNEGLLTARSQYWNFVDWSYGLNDINLNGRNTAVLNWFYVIALDTYARLLESAGRTSEAQPLHEKARIVADSINRRFWDPTRERYAEWLEEDGLSELSSQLVHALALISGHVPSDRLEAVKSALNDEKLLEPELYLSYILFKAMHMAGQDALIMERIRKYWLPMVQAGSPTIWEANVHMVGKKAFSDAGSLCHGFATGPAHFLQTVVVGVRPVEPGFTRFAVDPHPAGLQHASGSVHTPLGDAEVNWSIDGGEIALRVTVPPGATAVLTNGMELTEGVHRVKVEM